jgi:hypothetical protein
VVVDISLYLFWLLFPWIFLLLQLFFFSVSSDIYEDDDDWIIGVYSARRSGGGA